MNSDEFFLGIWKGKGVRASSKGLHAMLKIEWQTTRWNWKTNAQIKANHNKLCLSSPCDEYIKSIFRKCYFYWRKPVYFLKKLNDASLLQNLMHFINRKRLQTMVTLIGGSQRYRLLLRPSDRILDRIIFFDTNFKLSEYSILYIFVN